MSHYIAMQSYECVISTMFLIYFISYGCNDSALVFLGGAEASASPSFALPMFITIKKIIILHLFLGVPAATVGGTGTPWHTRGYAPDQESYQTCEVWCRSDIACLSYNNFLFHGETSKFERTPWTRPPMKTLDLRNLTSQRALDCNDQFWCSSD